MKYVKQISMSAFIQKSFTLDEVKKALDVADFKYFLLWQKQ